MKGIGKVKLISILFLSICVFFLLSSPTLANEGVGVTGSFSTYEYKIVQGETIDTPLINVVFINNYDNAIKLRIYQDTPDGVNIHLDDEIVELEANSRIEIPVIITADEDAIPGEYDIYVRATLVKDVVQGRINIGSEFALKTKLTVFGEAADLDIDVVDVAGEPIEAVLNLYQISESGTMTPIAYSDKGTMVERVIPGDYEVIAFWNDLQLVRHRFSVADKEQYKETLVAETVQIYAYTISPVFVEGTDNELATANIRFILHNIYKQLNNARVVMLVYKDDKLLEEKDIFLYDTLEVKKHELGLHYVPAQGWQKAKYTFKLEFYVDQYDENGEITNSILYASSVPNVLDASGLTFKKMLEFFSPRLIIIVLIAGLLVGLFFLIKYLLKRMGGAAKLPETPAIPAPAAVSKRNCPDCNGKGIMECPVCMGKGTTKYGAIEEECIYCSGIGKVSCASCVNPKHLIICPKCNGDKYTTEQEEQVDCTYCNGVGHVVARQYAKSINGVKLKLGKKS